jgi:hypothetical protein
VVCARCAVLFCLELFCLVLCGLCGQSLCAGTNTSVCLVRCTPTHPDRRAHTHTVSTPHSLTTTPPFPQPAVPSVDLAACFGALLYKDRGVVYEDQYVQVCGFCF